MHAGAEILRQSKPELIVPPTPEIIRPRHGQRLGLELTDDGRKVYQPEGPTLVRYLTDRSHVAIIRGPIGSGTSTASCYRLAMTAIEQWPQRDGIRRTRWIVMRTTYPDLVNTTLKTWLDWFPEDQYGRVNRSRPMSQMMRWADVEAEIFFLAADDESDIRKMRSLEITGGFVNELEYTIKPLFDELESRTGRYPAEKDGGCRWNGLIADMNAPPEDHWVPQLRGEAPLPDDMPEDEKARWVWPSGWEYFVQPAALIEVFGPDGKTVVDYKDNPEAENLKWLPAGFYQEKRQGKTKQWIDSRLMNRITFISDGDPVWPNYKPEVHSVALPLPYIGGRLVLVSLDFGRRPAALISQEVGDKLHYQREFRMYGVGAAIFAPALKRFLTQNYPGAVFKFTGDEKGQDRGQADERTAYEIFEAHGMHVDPCRVKNNHLETRIEAVSYALQTMRILVSTTGCPTLTAALAGKYHLKKMDAGDAEPVKDKFSDIADCLQYSCIWYGEGRVMIGQPARGGPRSRNAMAPRRSLRRVRA